MAALGLGSSGVPPACLCMQESCGDWLSGDNPLCLAPYFIRGTQKVKFWVPNTVHRGALKTFYC